MSFRPSLFFLSSRVIHGGSCLRERGCVRIRVGGLTSLGLPGWNTLTLLRAEQGRNVSGKLIDIY